MEYIKTPLNFSHFFDGSKYLFERCSENESIDRHLELLLMTMPGEHRFDENYGCRIGELDFERIESNEKWQEVFHGYIANTVQEYEKRIMNVEIQIDVKDWVQEEHLMRTVSVRKRIDVIIQGNLVSSGEKCGFRYSLYMGPLSNE